MSKKVEDYMVKSYQKQGYYNSKSCASLNSIFTKLTKPAAFNGYQRRNRYDTWRFERAQGNYTLSQPTFTLYPTRDPVANWAMVATALGSANFLTNHYNTVSII